MLWKKKEPKSYFCKLETFAYFDQRDKDAQTQSWLMCSQSGVDALEILCCDSRTEGMPFIQNSAGVDKYILYKLT